MLRDVFPPAAGAAHACAHRVIQSHPARRVYARLAGPSQRGGGVGPPSQHPLPKHEGRPVTPAKGGPSRGRRLLRGTAAKIARSHRCKLQGVSRTQSSSPILRFLTAMAGSLERSELPLRPSRPRRSPTPTTPSASLRSTSTSPPHRCRRWLWSTSASGRGRTFSTLARNSPPFCLQIRSPVLASCAEAASAIPQRISTAEASA